MGCNAVLFGESLTFHKDLSLPPSGLGGEASKTPTEAGILAFHLLPLVSFQPGRWRW
jgi:hypothetical protein